METANPYLDPQSFEKAIWLFVLLIVIFEFNLVKNILVFIFWKLYEFFIQRNVEEL